MIERFLKSLPPNVPDLPIILDIGSRDGEQSLEFASHFPTARIFAFEARPRSALQTRINVAHIPRIEVVETAVHNTDGTITFHETDDENPGASSLFIFNSTDFAPIPALQKPTLVNAARLDTWAKTASINRFDIVWMDLQGAELLALQGMGDLLHTVQAVQLEISYRQMYHGQVLWPELRRFMETNGMMLVDEWPDVSGYWGDAVFVRQTRKHKMLSFNKVANINDFNDLDFLASLRRFGAGCVSQFPLIPIEQQNRKAWEVGMAIHSLDKLGAVHPKSEILGIGAAREETISLLSPHIKRLFATDIYLDQGAWSDWHGQDLMIDASKFMGIPFNRRRVVWQHVDGRSLPYDDNSFDAIFSSSSFEHFGSESDIRQAISEACRVLKPGGVAVISTEFKIAGPRDWFGNVQLFDAARIQRIWLDGIDWQLASPLDLELDNTPFIDFERSIHDEPYKLTAHPHIKLDNGEFKWTSVNLTLVKTV